MEHPVFQTSVRLLPSTNHHFTERFVRVNYFLYFLFISDPHSRFSPLFVFSCVPLTRSATRPRPSAGCALFMSHNRPPPRSQSIRAPARFNNSFLDQNSRPVQLIASSFHTNTTLITYTTSQKHESPYALISKSFIPLFFQETASPCILITDF